MREHSLSEAWSSTLLSSHLDLVEALRTNFASALAMLDSNERFLVEDEEKEKDEDERVRIVQAESI